MIEFDNRDLTISDLEKKLGAHICPVCGKWKFLSNDMGEVCEECGWESDSYQEENPDVAYCCNRMTLNQAKKAYAEGKPVC